MSHHDIVEYVGKNPKESKGLYVYLETKSSVGELDDENNENDAWKMWRGKCAA